MNIIKNTQGITNIAFDKNITLYCPLGKGFYLAKVSVCMEPGDKIMDYLDVEDFFKSIVGKELIIEDAVELIYNHINQYEPEFLKVSITAESNIHFPVTVTKY